MKKSSINSEQNAIIKRTLNLQEFIKKYLNPTKIKDFKNSIQQQKNNNKVVINPMFK